MSESSARPKTWRRRLGIACAIAASVGMPSAGCNLLNDLVSPSSSTSSPTTSTETFTGTLSAQGSAVSTFTVAKAGTVSVTLSALSASVAVGLGIGTPNGASVCTLTTTNATTTAGSTAQIVITQNPGAYCVSVYDVGKLTGSTTFSVSVSHP